MAKAKYLKGLFESYSKNDSSSFTEIANQIIEEERSKHHYKLANELERFLNQRSIKSHSNHLIDENINQQYLNLLPKDKDSNMPLLESRTPDRLLSDLSHSKEVNSILTNIVNEYESKDIFSAYNLKPKTKILFCGPPGCGKTVSAEAVANELNLPILYTRFDSIVSSFLGETASNLRKLFDFVSKGKWVLFFDEFDAIAKTRDSKDEHGELKRVVNTFLQLLDSYSGESIIIAATNHQQLLDSAIWRRFDEVIYFDLPDNEAVYHLVSMHLLRYPNNINVDSIVNYFDGFSHSDIEMIFENSIKKAIMHRTELTNDLLKREIEQFKVRNNIYIK